MSEINEIHSMPAAVEQSAGKVERENKRVIKEENISKNSSKDAVLYSSEKNNDTREEGRIKNIRAAVDTINESLKETHTSIKMKYHDELNRISIKIVDDETQKVIKEIPPEDTLDMIQKMLEQAGVIVDERG